ncbi:hypothetical protein Sjap_009868 [Stephania japonica]|uniref:Fatty acid desaturase domain-containing protein n=1 Tax=Stephania japonica TaxID=461633 RepID=A0AAP0J8G7_9MAGN
MPTNSNPNSSSSSSQNQSGAPKEGHDHHEKNYKIVLSDVAVKRKNRAYWLRQWNLWDLTSSIVVMHVHVMCLLYARRTLHTELSTFLNGSNTCSLIAVCSHFRWVALLSFGEGWHNNHHAFEFSARHGHEWWQFDSGWYVIKVLELVGLATHVKVPSEAQKIRRMVIRS